MAIFLYVEDGDEEKLFFYESFCFCLLFFWGLFIVIVIYVNFWRLRYGGWDERDERGEDELVCEEFDSLGLYGWD